jgi:hypothetical protein
MFWPVNGPALSKSGRNKTHGFRQGKGNLESPRGNKRAIGEELGELGSPGEGAGPTGALVAL